VAAVLRQNHATGAYCDHFWPGLQMYYGEKVYFTGTAPQETYDPADRPLEHFGFDPSAPPADAWFIHFRKENDPSFAHWLNDPHLPKIRVGDFVVGPMTPLRSPTSVGSPPPLLTETKAHLEGK